MPPHPIALTVYSVLGPGLALLLSLGLVTARFRLTKLRKNRVPLPEAPPPPLVAVLVPAHNEGPGIRSCLESVLALDYPRFSVVAVDDRSTDDTHARMREIAATSAGRLTVLHLDSKPADWLGKCHALHVAALHPAAESADWLLFVDSDVTISPASLRLVMAQALARKLDAVSVLTRQRCETFWERLLTPLACGAILAMYVASATNDDNRTTSAFANGQFFLIRRSAYERAGGHEAVRNMPTEDVDLMRALKRTGSKCRLYAGDELAETRMYDSLARMFSGWARIYSGASHRRPWRILLACMFVLSFLSAFVMPLLAHSPIWLAAGLIHLLVVLANLAAIYAWSGNPPGYALLFPLAGVMQLAFFGKALRWCVTNRMEWRGTTYSAPTQS